MASINLIDVSKRYADGEAAVAELNLAIADGEFVVLVGPSGSGKSTALNMIAGLEDISSGEIWIGDRLVNNVAPQARDVAMVFQSYALYPHMTVRENMSFSLTLAKMRRTEIERRVREAAVALELEALLDRKPAQLSGGQRQRVAMGRAIVREPQAFLMDEPLSNLDAKLRVQTREQIAQLQKRLGTTTVYVTHDQTEALTLGDRIAVLRDGRLQQVGSADELYLQPDNLFVAGFIGSPAMNMIAGAVDDGAVEGPFGRLGLDERLNRATRGAGDVIVGVRPEDLEPAGPGDGGLRLDAVIDTVESTGADLYAHARVGHDAARIVARLDPETGARSGMRVALRAESERVYLFDAASGRALAGAVSVTRDPSTTTRASTRELPGRAPGLTGGSS